MANEGWISDLLGYKRVRQDGGADFPARAVLDLRGDVAIADDPTTGVTRISVGAGGATSVVWKESVRVATTAHVTLSGLQVIDGATLATNDRVLVWRQNDPRHNGVYEAKATAWTRAGDFAADEDVKTGSLVLVRGGAVYAGSTFDLVTAMPVVIGVSELEFRPISTGMALNLRAFGAVGNGVADDWGAILEALAAAEDAKRPLYGPPGNYRTSGPIVHPALVRFFGAGADTVIRQDGDFTLWKFATGVCRGQVSDMLLVGIEASQFGIGVDMTESQFNHVDHVQVWDFGVGYRLSNGAPFAAYNVIGPLADANRCKIGFQALQHANANTIHSCRAFWCFDSGNGVGFDVDDVEGLRIAGCQAESADLCLRIRNTNSFVRVNVESCYFEPGAGGRCYDIEVVDQGDAVSIVDGRGNIPSGNLGRVVLPPEGFHYWDGFSKEFFGARFSGVAAGKRNYVRNGTLRLWNWPTLVPNWFVNGTPTVAEETDEYVTDGRSVRVTQSVSPSDGLSCAFRVNDPGVQWVTCGCRYKVVSGDGFLFAGTVGGNSRQLPDAEISGGWQERWVEVPVDPDNRNGAVTILADSNGNGGEVLIDEVWAHAGRYASPSTRYGETLELLQAPLVVHSEVNQAGNDVFTVDLLDQTGLLRAPDGVVGAMLRARIVVHNDGAPGMLTDSHYVYVDTGGGTQHKTYASRMDDDHTSDLVVRGTTITGGYIATSGLLADYQIYLVGWVIQ